MQKQITVRQGAILVFIIMIATKLTILPSMISYNSANDTWLIFAFSLLLDFVISIAIIALMQKLDETIFSFIKKKFGKIVAIILFVILGLFFAIKIVDVVLECYIMLNEKIYIQINSLWYLITVGVVIIYFGTRELRSLGRTIEILFTLIVGILILALLISSSDADVTNILPLAGTGIKRLSQNMFTHYAWFGDSLVMLFFVGNIKKEKNMGKKLMLSYLASTVLVLVFVVAFTAVFANTASIHRSCVLDICEILPRLLTEGRFNWIVDFVYPIVPVLAIAVFSYISCNCFSFGIVQITKRKKLASIWLLFVLVACLLVMFRFRWEEFYAFNTTIMPYVSIALQYFLPIILLILCFATRKKEGAKQ